jgi:hypothetical protein
MKLTYLALAAILIMLPATGSAHESAPTDKSVVTTEKAVETQGAPDKIVAHSGRTNKDGCHNDRKKGTYHCH